MAGVKINSKIYPSDLHRQAGALAIKLPMNNNKFGDVSGLFNMSYTTEEQSISNYINLLLTAPGERYMQPNLGVGLMNYVFEPNSDGQRIYLREQIRAQSARWLPYIINRTISVQNSDDVADVGFEVDGHGLLINIDFSVTEYGANRTIQLYGANSEELNVDIS